MIRVLYAQWSIDGDGPKSTGQDELVGYYIEPSYKFTEKFGVIAKGVYQQPSAFLNEVFNSKPPKARMIWLTRARRLQINKILGHKPNRLRIRYWKRNQRTVWILDEVGKDKPITTGIVINKGRIELMKVLIISLKVIH